MANYPRTEAGFASAMSAVVWHTGMHKSTIYLYVETTGKEYVVSIIDPVDQIADGTTVGAYDENSFTADDREARRLVAQYDAIQDAPDQAAEGE